MKTVNQTSASEQATLMKKNRFPLLPAIIVVLAVTHAQFSIAAEKSKGESTLGVLSSNSPNLSPVAGFDVIVTDEDTPATGNLLSNDSDPEGGTIHAIAETKNTLHGQVVILADGSYVYTPNANYHGSDSFTYQVCDDESPNACSTGNATVTITSVNDAPVGMPDFFTMNEDSQLDCGCLIVNDTDADGDHLTAILASPPSNGTITTPGGNFVYTPNPDFFGTDTFTYYANDGTANSQPTLVTIIVRPVNDPPIAFNDQVVVDEDTPTNLPLLSNDIDVDDVLTVGMIIIGTPPAHGTITISTANGTVIYSPELNYYGNDSFTYTLRDAAGATSNTATVSIVVNPVNDAPVANADVATTPEEVPVSIFVLLNDTDVDNALDVSSLTIVSNPAHGTAVVQMGAIVYTPVLNFNGDDTFTYTVKDIDGAVSAPATVTVTVTPVNDPPVAVDDEAATFQNIAVSIPILANDHDVDNDIIPGSVVITVQPQHGAVTFDASSGLALYTPSTDYLGNDTFNYSIRDPEGLTSEASVFVIVEKPNYPPTAVDDGPIEHPFTTPLTIDVLANDYDVDNEHSELTIVSVSNPSAGSVTIVDGKIVYQPEGTTSATVTFTYTIQDPSGLTDEAVVTIEYVYNSLLVSQGFSPNGDGNNDTWYIRSIENYPGNVVKVFDRWGLLVYQKQQYQNTGSPWDGRGNTGQQAGKLLDQGTYYYLLNTGGELKALSGFVMIVR